MTQQSSCVSCQHLKRWRYPATQTEPEGSGWCCNHEDYSDVGIRPDSDFSSAKALGFLMQTMNQRTALTTARIVAALMKRIAMKKWRSQWLKIAQDTSSTIGVWKVEPDVPFDELSLEEKQELAILEAEVQERQYLDSPAWGYDRILEIHLNGSPVDTGIPMFSYREQQLIKTLDYQGNALALFDGSHYCWRNSCVNWYGQLISCNLKLGRFGFYLAVAQSAPVDPISPIRNSLIENEKLISLRPFILNALCQWLTENHPMSGFSWLIMRSRSQKMCFSPVAGI